MIPPARLRAACALLAIAAAADPASAGPADALEALRGAPPAHPAHFDFAVVPRGVDDAEAWRALAPDFLLAAAAPPRGEAPAIALFPDSADAPPAFAFTHGNTRFVAFAPGPPGAPPDPARVAWLRGDLEASTAANIVILVDAPRFAGDWSREWAPVAEVLAGFPVRWIVAMDAPDAPTRDFGDFDGPRYLALGGADGRFLLGRVRGGAVDGALVAAGAALPIDVRRDGRLDALARLRDAFECAGVEGPLGAPLDAPFTVTLRNPGAEPIAATAAWILPPGWRVEPPAAHFTAAPGAAHSLPFRAIVASPDTARFPVPALAADLPGPAGPVSLRVPLPFLPTLDAPRAARPVAIDGALDEWASVPPHRLTYAHGYSVFDTGDLVAWVRAQWTPEALAVAVEVRDDDFAPAAGADPRDGDHIRVRVGGDHWILALGDAGPRAARDDGGALRPAPALPVAIRRDGPRRVYEAAFAFPAPPVVGQRIPFSVEVHDHDPAHPRRPPHHAGLLPASLPEAPPAATLILVD